MSDPFSVKREPQSHRLQKTAPTVARVDRMHELGNTIVALQYCFRQLGGRQGTDELEGVVRTGLEICKQGMAAFREIQRQASVREHDSSAKVQLGDDVRAQALRYQMRAAEYHAAADQMQNLKARASHRHLAQTYEAMGRRLEDHVRWYGPRS
jgi:hypothetical protein